MTVRIAALALLGAATPLAAQLTYLDATSGAGGNTTLSDGSLFEPPLNGTTGADNRWEQRTSFASGGTVYESGGEAAEDAPELRTTITGLTPGGSYTVYAHFWDGSGTGPNWTLRAGFTSDAGNHVIFANPDAAATLGAVEAAPASSLDYATAPTVFTEGDRTMFAGRVGTTTADASGEIQVFLDDLPSTNGPNLRSWFDGLSHEPASDENLVTYVDATLANTSRWDGEPFSPAAQGNTVIDDNWEARTLGNAGSVFESNADGAEDAPLLVTTLRGLEPDTEYVLYAYFWHDGRNWRLKASADAAAIDDNGTAADPSDDFLPSTPLSNFASTDNAGGTASHAGLASANSFVVPPLFTEDNRSLRQAALGTATSNGAGELSVYLDDVAGLGEPGRVWFDGVGYKLALPLDPAADEDGDGLANGDEESHGTDPYLPDTDGDTYSDGVEVAAGSDPLDAGSVPPLPGNALAIAPDGVWTWFNDERAIFHQGSLFAGYVKADGQYGVTRYDPAANESHHMIISTGASRQQDDHNNPSITVLPDGKLLVLYAKHLGGPQFYQRTSLVELPSTDADWGPEIVRPLTDNNTYNNTYLLSTEGNRIYNFHRNINFNPTITISDDLGASWQASIPFIEVGSGNVRPYPRYCSNREDRIDLIYTDGHPRDIDNSVYHMFYRDGAFHRTDGTEIDTFDNLPLDHQGGQRGSVIYPYSAAAWGPEDGPDDWIPTGRGWTWDVHYGADGHPVCVFQVQRDNVTGSGWNHDRIYYYYARWTGSEWQRKFIAQAGRGIYAAEDDYGGGMCLDPTDPNVVYLSSNAADPFALDDIDDVPLASNERYEIYRGVTRDGGQTFTWTPLTQGSPADNLRPIIPENHGYDRALVWFYGNYTSYTNYDCQVLALLENDLEIESSMLGDDSGELSWRSSPGRRYRIGGSTDLRSFPFDAATGIDSQGGTTAHPFAYPTPILNAPSAFFRVEEE